VSEFIFEEQIFTQRLDVFTGVCFLSDGAKIVEPTIVHLTPYFSDYITNGIKSKKWVKMNKPEKSKSERRTEQTQRSGGLEVKEPRKRYHVRKRVKA